MALETGVAKKLTYKKETTWGTIAGASGGQRLRRVTSDIDLKKDTYQSNEIRDDYQVSDFRHGMRKVEGSIQGELSAKTYGAFFESLLRRDFTTVTSLTGLSLTIAGTAT
jgi:soluble cytochrome b562